MRNDDYLKLQKLVSVLDLFADNTLTRDETIVMFKLVLLGKEVFRDINDDIDSALFPDEALKAEDKTEVDYVEFNEMMDQEDDDQMFDKQAMEWELDKDHYIRIENSHTGQITWMPVDMARQLVLNLGFDS